MPTKFFNVIIHKNESIPDLHGICAGFEGEQWRKEQLVDHLFEYLPEFALNYSEYEDLCGDNAISKIRQAAANIYKSQKFKSRGEFGELLLHSVIRETYSTIPAISKIFYKDGPNETVKGFDAVHVIDLGKTLELWLGEAKFYSDISAAICSVVKELKQHVEIRYIRSEFIAITNKIDKNWKHSDKFKKMLDPNTSLDDVFENTCIPVLLTYDSNVLAKYKISCAAYLEEITQEFTGLHSKFCNKLGKFPVTIHLFLLPLNTKEELVKCFDNKLRGWQSL